MKKQTNSTANAENSAGLSSRITIENEVVHQSAPDTRAARVSGADWWTTSFSMVMRLLKPALFSAFAVLFICFFKDYATAVFLFAPGSEVIGTTLLSFWIQGDAGPVAALAMLQVLITFVFVYGVRFAFGVRVYG